MMEVMEDLSDHLENENMGQFEKRKAQMDFHPNPLASYELFNAVQDKSRLACSPPVKLYVSKIPPALNINGLRNIFTQYGQIRDLSQPRVGNSGQSEWRYAFVSYSSLTEALRAIEALSQRPPLHLEVQLSRDEQEAFRRRRMEEEMEKFSLKVACPDVEEEEEDWDKEIADRERLDASVERFMEEEEESEIRPLAYPCTEAGKKGAVQKESVVTDSSGKEIFVEADLPETDLKKNSLANILGETLSDCHYFAFINYLFTTYVCFPRGNSLDGVVLQMLLLGGLTSESTVSAGR